ncbi:OmpA family protein [Aliivibrio sifiae]|uniref:Cell envelope biogenesis protein OmpA n=1 Tax=Aliivibrio sifiae TaxID=566293 RepID=A0A2S7X8D0_9GAMM|nr:OmpA family protein [Aliivibrio sifiae]PQJ87600.1 cell envelope biogenesis protein OmpA [Aliivibrio sifiae]GLR73212.1 OmpA family protein [Aliivibrio sifiae]
MMSNKAVLAEGVYLFSTHFYGEYNETIRKTSFENWHLNPKIVTLGNDRKNNGVDNIRPVPFTPLIANIKELSERVEDQETNGVWGTDKHGLIHALDTGVQAIAESGDFEYLQHKSVVNHLDAGEYSLCFPPLAILSRLTISKTTPIEIAKELYRYSSMVDKGKDSEVTFALTEIGIDQLAKPFSPSLNGALSQEQKEYNQWYEEVSKKGDALKGFLLPSQATCSVVFSHKSYINAAVSIRYFDSNEKNGDLAWKVIGEGLVKRHPDASEHFPAAVINVNPESFQEGYYSIRVNFHPDNFDGGIPEYITNANITKIVDLDGITSYQYELREYIRFDNHTPLGKMAIVCGDMISLEESLICQFPQYLSHLTAHLKGKATNTKALESPALTSLAVLTGANKVSMMLGMDLLADGLTPQLDNGPTAMVNNIAKLYWEEIKNKNLPTAMQATGEILFGLQSMGEGLGKLKELTALQAGSATYRAEFGASALFKSTIFDKEKYGQFTEYLAKANQEFKDGKYKAAVGRLSKTWLQGADLAGRGLVAVDTLNNIAALFNHGKEIAEQKKKAEKARGNMAEVASEYLKHIPVWTETQLEINKENKQAFEQLTIKNKTLFNDDYGSGIEVVFEFDKKTADTSMVRQGIAEIVSFLEKQPDVHIVIEGHTCQVGTNQYNMNLSQQRAQNVADLFPKKLQEKITVIAFGETQPLVEATGREVSSDNFKLKVNRRVKIKAYLKVLDIVYAPSRSGMGVLERSRLITLNAMQKEDDAILAAQLALLESLIGVACFIPVIGPAARGMLLIKEGSNIVQSGLAFLDEMLFDYAYETIIKAEDAKDDLADLAKIQMELLNQLRQWDSKLETKLTSYESLTSYLTKDETKNEILKRYQLRALAFNGLMMVLLYAHSENQKMQSGKNLNLALDKYDIKGYIEKYLQNDSWSVNTIKSNDLGIDWINQCKQKQKQDIPLYYQTLPTPIPASNYLQYQAPQDKGKVSGKFSRAFPVQGLLYELPSENKTAMNLFEEFAQNFSPLPPAIDLDEIALQRVLVSDQDGKDWVEYSKWKKENQRVKINRLSPFHRLKIQIVLSGEDKPVFPYEIGYQRVDGANIEGPKFSVLFKPMALSDFTYQDERLKAIFAQDKALTAIEFEPFYYFGNQRIYGLKPIVSKLRVESLYAIHWLGLQKILNVKESAFEEYVSSGGFRHMRYELQLQKPNSKHHQAILFDENNNDEIHIGVHSENSHKVILEDSNSGSIQTLNFISEGRLLEVEEFTYSQTVGESVSINVIDKILYQAIGVDYKNKCYLAKPKNEKQTISDFSWDKADELETLHILVCGESHKDEYETLKVDWKSVDAMVQLQTAGYVSEEEKTSNYYHQATNHTDNSSSYTESYLKKNINIKKVGGPIYQSKLNYVGEICHTGVWNLSIDKESKEALTDKISTFLNQSIHELNSSSSSLDKKKGYAIHVISFNLKYMTPTGINASGLRPFGNIIQSQEPLFNLNVAKFKQLNTESDVFLDGKPLKLAMPTLNHTQLIDQTMPWMESGAKGKQGVSGDIASEWDALDEKQRILRIKKWIEKQPSSIELKAKQFL